MAASRIIDRSDLIGGVDLHDRAVALCADLGFLLRHLHFRLGSILERVLFGCLSLCPRS